MSLTLEVDGIKREFDVEPNTRIKSRIFSTDKTYMINADSPDAVMIKGTCHYSQCATLTAVQARQVDWYFVNVIGYTPIWRV